MDFYGTVEGFLEYCRDNGYDVDDLPPSPPEAVEVLLRRGSAYIDGSYRSRYPGRKTGGRAQVRDWPRTGARDASGESIAPDEIPIEVEQATYEAAIREHNAPGSLTPDYVATERVRSESVGPLSVTYADSSSSMSAQDALPVISQIDMILEPLLGPSSSGRASLFGEVTR